MMQDQIRDPGCLYNLTKDRSEIALDLPLTCRRILPDTVLTVVLSQSMGGLFPQ